MVKKLIYQFKIKEKNKQIQILQTFSFNKITSNRLIIYVILYLGTLLLSGFYESDVPKMEIALANANLQKVDIQVLNEWTLLVVQK